MDDKQLTVADIKAAVHEVIEEQRKNFWIPAEEHWRHHEQMRECMQSKPDWAENHKFVSEVRKNANQAWKVSIGVAVTSFVVWVIARLFGKA